jgi:hypothetical protein
MKRINLMPRPERPETLERLRNAQVGAYKSLVYSLRKENEAQRELIEMYRKYFDFMERRYPMERKGTDAINGAGSAKRETSQGQAEKA